MFKKFALAAVFVLATIGLTAAPANAAPTGALAMHSGTNFTGDFAILSEGAIVTGSCTEVPLVPAGLTALSASNTTTSTEVKFFASLAACSPTATPSFTLSPGDAERDMTTAPGVGVRAYLATTI